jgi:hypothetical protein
MERRTPAADPVVLQAKRQHDVWIGHEPIVAVTPLLSPGRNSGPDLRTVARSVVRPPGAAVTPTGVAEGESAPRFARIALAVGRGR